MKVISRTFLSLLFYPFLHILSHIRLLMDNPQKQKLLAEELSLIFISVEAPLQIMYTFWLIMRGLVVSPLSSEELSLVSWSEDRFGNPIPVPALPLASILTSLSSLLLVAARLHFRNVVFTSLKENFWNFVEKMSFVLFSLLVRMMVLTFLWIYFDSKTAVLIVTLIILNFFVIYRLEYADKCCKYGEGFSIWLTTLVNTFLPCWYYRKMAVTNLTQEYIFESKIILN